MTDYYTPDEEFRCAKAQDAIVEMYRSCAFRQTEAALEFERVVTNGDARVPTIAEVQGWLSGVVRGSLVARPEKLSWWQRTYNTVRGWVVM